MAQLSMFDGSTDRGGATGTSCASEAEGAPKFWAAEIHGETIGIHGELTNKHRELIWINEISWRFNGIYSWFS